MKTATANSLTRFRDRNPAGRLVCGKGRGQSPSPEFRIPKEVRKPKAEEGVRVIRDLACQLRRFLKTLGVVLGRRLRRLTGVPRSAGWQPAVSQPGRLRARSITSAGCQPAIQQRAPLRYGDGCRRASAWGLVLLASVWTITVGCGGRGPDVVVYAAQDRTYAGPLLQAFEAATGRRVAAVYDNEAVKTVGLANRLLAERTHPVADIFWGNEELRTRQLAAAGVFVSPNGWRSFGWRSRRIIVNTNRLPLAKAPRSLTDLTNAAWRGRVVMALPLFGTTATHLAALRQHWGDVRWEAWCRGLRANDCFLVDGNSVAARRVARGEAWIGLTDSDDFRVVKRQGAPVTMLPLNEESLLIPNTVGVVRGGPHPEAARELADYLAGPDVVRALVEAGALEGADPAEVTSETLQPDWTGLLRDLETTTTRLSEWFAR